VSLSDFLDDRFTDGSQVVSLTRRLALIRRMIPGSHFCKWVSRPQGHSAAGMSRLIEKSSDLIGNQTRHFPACSTVPQPNMLPRAPSIHLSIQFVYTTHGDAVVIRDYSWQINTSVYLDNKFYTKEKI
jgi:hypothetical protein